MTIWFRNLLSNNRNLNASFSNMMCARVLSTNVINLFQDTFGLRKDEIKSVLLRNARLQNVTPKHLSEVIEALETFDIDKDLAIKTPSVLILKAKSIIKHGQVLLECGFTEIKPLYLVTYFNIVKKKTLEELKNDGLLRSNLNVRRQLSRCFTLWSKEDYPTKDPTDKKKTLVDLRFIVLQKYLDWRLGINRNRFNKIVNTYNKFRHTPLAYMEESITLAQNDLELSDDKIRANPFFICADPKNTLKILNEVKDFSGTNAKEAIHFLPSIIKEDYQALLEINTILKEHNMPSSRRLIPLYVFKPENLKARIVELEAFPEYRAHSSNHRLPRLVEYKKTVVDRIKHYKTLNKHCFSLHSLITPPKNYERKLTEFGDKNWTSDILTAVESRLSYPRNAIRAKLSQNGNWGNVSTVWVVDTLSALLERFSKQEVFDNCQLVLYSRETIEKQLNYLMNLKMSQHSRTSNNINDFSESEDETDACDNLEASLNSIPEEMSEDFGGFEPNVELEELLNIDYSKFNNSQLLSMALYLIERDYCFSGDGIWSNDRQMLRNNA